MPDQCCGDPKLPPSTSGGVTSVAASSPLASSGGDTPTISLASAIPINKGGTGAAKCGGNYASSLIAQYEGAEHGCSQVLFADAGTGVNTEELGGMNIMVVTAGGELITPALTGTILEGVTRDSILTMAGDLGLTPVARPITLAEIFERIDAVFRLRRARLGLLANPLKLAAHLVLRGVDRLTLTLFAFGLLFEKVRIVAVVGIELAVVEFENLVADRFEKITVVRDEKERNALALQITLKPLDHIEIEVVCRLVENQHVGFFDQSMRERDTLTFAA